MWKIAKSIPPSIVSILLLLGGFERQGQPSLWVYDFNLGMGPVGNVEHVESLGFDGIVTRVGVPADLVKLRAYARHVDTIADFDLLAFVNYDFDNPSSPQVWRDALPILAKASRQNLPSSGDRSTPSASAARTAASLLPSSPRI